MASTVVFFLLLSAGLFTVTVGYGDDCKGYYTSSNMYKPPIYCGSWEHCCGTCGNRYCCSSELWKLTEDDQEQCNRPTHSPGFPKPPRPEDDKGNNSVIAIVAVIVGIVVSCIVSVIVCCCCPCCFIYKMCQKPIPVVRTQVYTVGQPMQMGHPNAAPSHMTAVRLNMV
ncbi:protein shisa-5-like isoform X2 [Pseudorasbora parva]|uniref:protein shisa-5-like isoform X2 n=1 Tax=Pseudorasbora parva TaxID=51549 RepID=UPI00351E75CB